MEKKRLASTGRSSAHTLPLSLSLFSLAPRLFRTFAIVAGLTLALCSMPTNDAYLGRWAYIFYLSKYYEVVGEFTSTVTGPLCVPCLAKGLKGPHREAWLTETYATFPPLVTRLAHLVPQGQTDWPSAKLSPRGRPHLHVDRRALSKSTSLG